MKFSTITKRRGLFNLKLCSAFESECYSVFYDETILFDNEIYLHNETNHFWEKFHCDIRILYSCFFAVPQGAKSGDPYPQWNCSFAPEIWKALWHKGFCKRKKHDSCNTNGIITIVLIWSEWRDLTRAPAGAWSLAVTTVHRTVALCRSSFKSLLNKKHKTFRRTPCVFGRSKDDISKPAQAVSISLKETRFAPFR